MSKKSRRQFSAEQKAEILRQHLFEKVPISDLADKYKVQPSVIYGWQRQLQINMAVALETGKGAKRGTSRERKLKEQVGNLEAKLTKKNMVIAELTEEFVTLKKGLGEP